MSNSVSKLDFTSASSASKTVKPYDASLWQTASSVEERDNSSLATAAAPAAGYSFFSRPELTVPDYGFIRALEGQYAVGQGLAEIQTADNLDKAKLLETLCLEKAQKIRENAEKTKSSQVWSFLKKIASYVAAAISTVFGLSLITTAGLTAVAGTMIASGVLSIANLLLIETGIWDQIAERLANKNEETKRRLKFMLPTVVGALSAVIGLVGSSGALLWGPLNFSQTATAAAMTALSFVQGVTSVGGAVSEARRLWCEAELISIETRRDVNQIQLQRAHATFEKTMQSQSRAAQIVSEIIRISASNYQEMHI